MAFWSDVKKGVRSWMKPEIELSDSDKKKLADARREAYMDERLKVEAERGREKARQKGSGFTFFEPPSKDGKKKSAKESWDYLMKI